MSSLEMGYNYEGGIDDMLILATLDNEPNRSVQKRGIGMGSLLARVQTLSQLAVRASSSPEALCVLFFARGGNVNGGSLNNSGNNGNYWSSSVNSSSNAYNLNFNATNVNPQNNNNRNNGFTVRCLAR